MNRQTLAEHLYDSAETFLGVVAILIVFAVPRLFA